ncbi:hypothetical protein [Paraflavitalea sp. CAU 1676]|uniref:hypothetical protein n=1 Tax=Paraflavitalea sp. CAU 1676 TaxID=3032598 RepID=UPI0023D9A30A|nr:hypothetical protein [Paraflavitalea sp. CAU 1676]MDF2188183.1 hypothetical protein [Paraflavitalea sp. CAU 1676]
MSRQPIKILAIGRNAEIMEVMQRLINVPDKRSGVAVTTDEEAEAAWQKETFDLVMLCAGIDEEAEKNLRNKIAQINPMTKVIRHYGGGSGLLENEIEAALAVPGA